MAKEVSWLTVSDVAGFLLTLERQAQGVQARRAVARLTRCKCPNESHWLGVGQFFAFLLEEGIENVGVFSKSIGLEEDFGIFEGRHYMKARFRADPSRSPAQAVVANMQVLQEKFTKTTSEEQFLEALAYWNLYRDILAQSFTASTKMTLPLGLTSEKFRERTTQKWLALLLFGAGSFTSTLSGVGRPHNVDERPPLPVARENDRDPSPYDLGRQHGFVAAAKAAALDVFQAHPSREAIAKTLARCRKYMDFGEDADCLIERKDPRWSLIELSRQPTGWSAEFRPLRDSDLLIQLGSPIGPPPDWSIGEIFRQRPIRTVVTGQSVTGWRFMEPVLRGLNELQQDDEIEVVRLKHREYGTAFSFSYAIYMPCGGAFTNAGEFWLYHSICGEQGGTSRSTQMLIQNALDRLTPRLVLREHEVDDERLQKFIVSKPLAILAARQKRLDDRLAHLRGSLGELAVCELLRLEGWPQVATRRLASVGAQFDCVAVNPKMNRALLIEVKSTLASIWVDQSFKDLDEILKSRGKPRSPKAKGYWKDDDGVKQILRIEAQLAKANSLEVCTELGLKAGAQVEMQVFVTGTVRVNGADRIASEVVTPQEFLRRCKDAEVPKHHYQPLALMRDLDADQDDRLGERLFDEFLVFRHRDSWSW